MRQSGVTELVCRTAVVSLSCILLTPPVLSNSQSALNTLIDGVEHRYNRAQTLAVDFTETYSILGHAKRPESGTVVLRKPGRMRWTYTQPAGKLFVSDGKNVFLYTASDNRVEKSKLKASEDMRAPMAFLLGKLDLKKQFKSFDFETRDGGSWLTATAANDRVPYEKVAMLIAPDFSIHRLMVTGRDQSVLDFAFSNEILNPQVAARAFEFTAPPGAEIVDAVSAGSEGN